MFVSAGEDALALIENVTNAPNIAEAFLKRASADPHSGVFWSARKDSADAAALWSEETYHGVRPKVIRLANYLMSRGIAAGTPIAILSGTREEWAYADLAILLAGGVTVSIYQSLPASEVGYILNDSGATIVFAENQEQVAKLKSIEAEAFTVPECERRPAFSTTLTLSQIITFEILDEPTSSCAHLGEILEDSSLSSEIPPQSRLLRQRSDVASIVYTSGTTGPAKGVVQTHENHLSNVRQATESGAFALDGTLFLYLPLAHSFARLIYYLGFLTPAKLIFPRVTDKKSSRIDLSTVATDMREAGASVVPSVPRLFEKIAAVLCSQAQARTVKGRLLRLCLDNSAACYAKKESGEKLSIQEKSFHILLRPLREKIKKQIFGKGFRHAVSGGAKLEASVCRFFDALEIIILEGYGLTETCVATNVNLVGKRKIGSVGPALRDVEVKIDSEDGEILFKGPNVTNHYHHRPQATKDAWTEDGWFRTGDIGKLDNDGFLYITDRKKDLIVTAAGKKIPPQSIEGRFKSVSQISQIILFGDGKPYCVALFTINPETVKLWLSSIEGSTTQTEPLHSLGHVRDLIQREVDRVNSSLSSFETIKRFIILPEDLSIENGLLTPTLKVKRKAVFAAFKNEIAELYRRD